MLITTPSQLFVWKPSSRLVEIDAGTIFRGNYPPLIFHPTDQETFFLVDYPLSRTVISVHELRLIDGKYQPCRTLTYDILQHTSARDIHQYDSNLKIRQADARGTFQLLELNYTGSGTQGRLEYVMFNTLTASFSVQVYETPTRYLSTAYMHEIQGQAEGSCVWEGQLILCCSTGKNRYSSSGALDPVLIGLDQRKTASFSNQDLASEYRLAQVGDWHSILAAALGSEGDTLRDIVRYQDIQKQCPTSPNYHEAFGLQYVCSLPERACTYIGSHQASCWAYQPASPSSSSVPLPAASSEGSATHYPGINHNHHLRDIDGFQGTRMVVAIYADDNFVVVFTPHLYTVFCVDADGKLAESMMSRVDM